MHETSLMYDVLRTVETSARENNIEEVTYLKLVIGNITTILPDALEFAFDSFRGNPPLAEDAELELDIRKPRASCKECGNQFELQSMDDFACPCCGGYDILLSGGEELYVEYYKGRERSD